MTSTNCLIQPLDAAASISKACWSCANWSQGMADIKEPMFATSWRQRALSHCQYKPGCWFAWHLSIGLWTPPLPNRFAGYFCADGCTCAVIFMTVASLVETYRLHCQCIHSTQASLSVMVHECCTIMWQASACTPTASCHLLCRLTHANMNGACSAVPLLWFQKVLSATVMHP